MFYVLTKEQNYDKYNEISMILVGIFSTKEKADDCRRQYEPAEHCSLSSYHLYESLIDTNFLESIKNEKCIYEKEYLDKHLIDSAINKENIDILNRANIQKRYTLKILCDNIINTKANDGLSKLIYLYNLSAVYIDIKTNSELFQFYPSFSQDLLSELYDSGKYLTHWEITMFANYFKCFDIFLATNFKRIGVNQVNIYPIHL